MGLGEGSNEKVRDYISFGTCARTIWSRPQKKVCQLAQHNFISKSLFVHHHHHLSHHFRVNVNASTTTVTSISTHPITTKQHSNSRRAMTTSQWQRAWDASWFCGVFFFSLIFFTLLIITCRSTMCSILTLWWCGSGAMSHCIPPPPNSTLWQHGSAAAVPCHTVYNHHLYLDTMTMWQQCHITSWSTYDHDPLYLDTTML